MTDIRAADPKPSGFTRRGRPNGAEGIHQIQIHATRGSTPLDRQVSATENWFAEQADQGGWGSSADFVIGPDYREDGAPLVIVQFGDWIRTFSSWSAGYGSLGAAQEWGAAEVGVAIEVAQPARWDGSKYVGGDSDVPFSDDLVEAVAGLCRHINRELESAGGNAIPTVHHPYWNQRRDAPIPRGYLGHDDLENGVRLGKTDPGQMWNWQSFLAEVGQVVDDSMSPILNNIQAGYAAFNNGAIPLHRTATHDRYQFDVSRRK